MKSKELKAVIYFRNLYPHDNPINSIQTQLRFAYGHYHKKKAYNLVFNGIKATAIEIDN